MTAEFGSASAAQQPTTPPGPTSSVVDTDQQPGILAGVKVLDVTNYAAGPIATRMLADWGATVIKIEHPVTGDPIRGMLRGAASNLGPASELNYIWEHYGRSKRSITLNLAADASHKIMSRLVASSDVFITSLRPRELTEYELTYEALSRHNPRLIYASLTGYGPKGPDRDLPAFDWGAFWARSGATRMHTPGNGSPPMWRPALGDTMTGLSLALGVAVGLFNRERTGRGHLISTSLLGNGIAGMGYDLAGALATQADFDPEPRESREPMILAYSTSDGRWLNLCLMPPDKYWPSLSKAIGRPELADDPRYASFAARQQHSDEVRELLEAAFATRPLADWNDVLDYHGISWAPVRSLGEVISDEQAIVNDYFITYKHETYGPVRGVAGPVQFEGYPPAPHQAPEFGQHTEETLLDAGYDWGDISEFRQDGVI